MKTHYAGLPCQGTVFPSNPIPLARQLRNVTCTQCLREVIMGYRRLGVTKRENAARQLKKINPKAYRTWNVKGRLYAKY